MKKKLIRNFSIIAHIDHGKSTLADRILDLSHAIKERDKKAQILDTMELEREKGITIKLNVVQLKYFYNQIEYQLNLIDTPGHVDFMYEVSRSLAASEGAILLVDATQGIESQTIANLLLALENNLEIIPVINKIDLENAQLEKTRNELKQILGENSNPIIEISAKTGINVEKVVEAIIEKIPEPKKAIDDHYLRALVFDSYYDSYRGIIIFVKIKQGIIKKGDKLKFIQKGTVFEVIEVGVNTPYELIKDELKAGETGWVITNLKIIKKIGIGDTITEHNNQNCKLIEGYKVMKPMVFSGFYPIDTQKYQQLDDAINKISLSDSSLSFEKETSKALGFGFRIGFLGLLHMEIIRERIKREFKIEIISTVPSVIYKIHTINNKELLIENPSDFPEKNEIVYIEEPYVKLNLYTPEKYLGKLIEYVHQKRGIYLNLEAISDQINLLTYQIPFAEIIFDFFNKIKSLSKGYASFDYERINYQKGDLVKLDVLISQEKVDALSVIVNKKNAYYIGRELTQKLKTIIPKQNFEIAIQAAIGNKVIARETVKAYRKDVTGYLYGGDVSRKKKLLAKQKRGKKRMKKVGKVYIPQEAFIAMLATDKK